MTTQQLLAEVNPLSHSARMRRMVELGRESASFPLAGEAASPRHLDETLTRLARGGQFLRYLALQACYGSRDGARILAGLEDPSRAVRALAFQLLRRVADEETRQQAAGRLSERQQRRLGLPEEDQTYRPRPEVWRRQARRHPDEMVARLLAIQLDASDGFVRMAVTRAFEALQELRPDAAVTILERLMCVGIDPERLDWLTLLRRRPQAVFAALEGRLNQYFPGLGGVAHQLTDEQLRTALERGWLPQPWNWLGDCSREQRALAWACAAPAWRDADGVCRPSLVALLPGPERLLEARRHLQLATIAARPSQRLPYCAFLPWEEALQELKPTLRDPDPELRQLSLATLVQTARWNDCQDKVLELLTARANEADPVRTAFMTELAGLPPTAWKPSHFRALGQILRAAWEAGDTSPATARQCERLLLRVLPLQPGWAAPWLIQLWRARGTLLGNPLVWHGKVMEAVRAELPGLLEEWRRRENSASLLFLGQALGRRLGEFPEVVDVLAALCRDPRGEVAGPALATLARHHAPALAELAPRLIQEDPSWVLHPALCAYLNRHRQDLLTPFLAEAQLRGRFATGEVRVALPIEEGFLGWTPEQQDRFASVLETLANDSTQAAPTWKRAVDRLARLPSIPPRALLALAGPQEKRAAVQEWALRALARLDGGQGVETLLQALEDARARIAIYALRRCLLEMPAARALEILRNAPMERVTVAKEVVRLLGELPNGLDDLLALPLTHRDVRIARLRALWEHLADERCWPLLEEAAADADPAVASALAAIPAANLAEPTRRRLASLLARTLAHPDPRARLGALRAVADFPDPDRLFLASLTSNLMAADLSLMRSAALTLIRLYRHDVPQMAALAREVAPHRQALKTLLEHLQGYWASDAAPAIRALLDVLGEDRRTLPLRFRLAAQGLPLPDFLALIEEALPDDAWDVYPAALECIPLTREALRLTTLKHVLDRWQTADPRLRRLALEWLLKTAARHGWTPVLRETLERFQADEAPAVSGLAQLTFPPPAG